MGKTYKESELIVGVTYYNNRIESVKQCGKDYEKLFDSYYKYLKCIHDEGIVSGETADAFEDLINQIEKLNNMISTFCKSYSTTVKSFLHDIDKADDVLFANKGRKVLTDKEFKNALYVTYMDFDFKNIGAWVVEKFFTGPVGAILADKSLEMVKRVQELNNVTKGQLQEIRTKVRLVDSDYKNQLRNIYKELRGYNDILKEIDKIMSPKVNNLNKKNVANLKDKIKRLEKLQKKTIKNPEHCETTQDDVVYFAVTIEDYWGDSTNTIIAICESSVMNALFGNDFHTYRATIEEAKKYFDKFSEEYMNSKEAFDEKKKEFDKFLELYLKYGDKFDKHVSEKEKAGAKDFKKLLSKIKTLSTESNEFIDLYYQLFFDMSKSREALERYKANCDMDNEAVRKAIEQLEGLYNKEIDAYLDETFSLVQKAIIEHGLEEAIKYIQKMAKELAKTLMKSENFLAGFALLLGAEGLNMIMDGFTEMQILSMCDWIESTDKTFENARIKLKNADPESSDYAELIKSVEEAFAAAKESRLSFFKKLMDISEGSEKKYYQYCYKMIENASMNDFESLELMSYSEYNGSNCNPLTDVTEPENILGNY